MHAKIIRLSAIMISLLMMLGLFSACAQTGTTSKTTTYFEGCLGATTLDDLCKGSVAIVRGTIAKYNRCVDVENTVRTYFTIDVNELIKGDPKYSKNIESWFMGGETKKKRYMPLNEELPQIGEEHIFFIYPAGDYYPLFQIMDNKINLEGFFESALYKKEPNSGNGATSQTVSADALIAEIKDIVAAQAQTAKQ